MMDKLKDYFKKNENMNETEKKDYENKMNIIKLAGCVLFIIIMIIYVNVMPHSNNNNQEQNNTNNIEENTILNELSDIKDNYKQKITISKDLEQLTIEREVLENNEAGRQIIDDKETNYIFYEKEYYIIAEDVPIKKDTTFDPYLGNDPTFINIENIIELINSSKESVDLIEEDYKIKRYKISLSDLIVIYNKANNAEIALKENKDINMNINYNENIESIEIDLTELFNLIHEENYKQVIYKIEYSDIEKIELDGIEELIKMAE